MDEPGFPLGERGRRALALMGLAIVALGAVAGFSLRSKGVRPPAAAAAPILFVSSQDWLSPLVGWVVLRDGERRSVLFHTQDGGRHWDPQFATVGGPISVHFFDRVHGLLTGPPPAPNSDTTLLRTDDGGDHWSPVPSVDRLGSRPSTSFFLDQDHGWTLVVTDRGPFLQDADVRRTDDGGRTWVGVAEVEAGGPAVHGLREDGLKGGIWFRTPLDGWLGSVAADGSVALYVTHDGGAQWRRAALPDPSGGWGLGATPAIAPPRVSADGRGAVLVAASARPADGSPPPGSTPPVAVVYTSHDGGDTWADPRPAPAGANLGLAPSAFVDGSSGWVAGGAAVWITSDGGRSWARRPALPVRGFVVGLAPVTPSAAVAEVSTAAGVAYPWKLLVTEDAGRTWSELPVPRLT